MPAIVTVPFVTTIHVISFTVIVVFGRIASVMPLLVSAVTIGVRAIAGIALIGFVVSAALRGVVSPLLITLTWQSSAGLGSFPFPFILADIFPHCYVAGPEAFVVDLMLVVSVDIREVAIRS